MKRGITIIVLVVNVRTLGNQQLRDQQCGNILVSPPGGVMKRGIANLVLGIDVRTIVQQPTDFFYVIRSCRRPKIIIDVCLCVGC